MQGVVVLGQKIRQDGKVFKGQPRPDVGKARISSHPDLSADQLPAFRDELLEGVQLLLQLGIEAEQVVQRLSVDLRHGLAGHPVQPRRQRVLTQVLHHFHVPRQHGDVARKFPLDVRGADQFLGEDHGGVVQLLQSLNSAAFELRGRHSPVEISGGHEVAEVAG